MRPLKLIASSSVIARIEPKTICKLEPCVLGANGRLTGVLIAKQANSIPQIGITLQSIKDTATFAQRRV
jgi:hypothetical protein